MSKNGTRPGALSINGDGRPGSTSIKLGGKDITQALTGLTLDLGVDELPMARLDVVLADVSTHIDGPSVYIPDATCELLTLLGWTPPLEDKGQRQEGSEA